MSASSTLFLQLSFFFCWLHFWTNSQINFWIPLLLKLQLSRNPPQLQNFFRSYWRAFGVTDYCNETKQRRSWHRKWVEWVSVTALLNMHQVGRTMSRSLLYCYINDYLIIVVTNVMSKGKSRKLGIYRFPISFKDLPCYYWCRHI